MNFATLTVTRVGDKELSFHLNDSQSGGAIYRASTQLDSGTRENIARHLEDFEQCKRGFHEDEPRFQKIGEILFQLVLPRSIREQLRQLEGPLCVLTDDPTLPWEILHDGEHFLALRLPIARQLIIQEQMAALLRPQASPASINSRFSSLIIADPTEDLPGAREEGEALYEFLRTKGHCDFVMGRGASSEVIMGYLLGKSYAVIHYCGHVDYDAKDKVSCMRLFDGRRLSSRAVLSTFRGSPIVFLNACYSDGHLAISDASARIEGFAQAFMLGNERGVASAVVGTMWEIPDEPDASREFTTAFYRFLFEGGSVGEAMRRCRVLARDRHWGPMMWGPYVLYGNPRRQPFPETTPSEAVPESAPSEVKVTKATTFPVQDDVLTVAPADPGLTEQLKDAVPLDNSARQVFHRALSEMADLDQGALCSMHLLIGLCEADQEKVGPLREAISEQRVSLEAVCEAARQSARDLVPAQAEVTGISQNTARMLIFAAERAKDNHNELISAEDLLAGVLSCESCEAVRILESFEVSCQELKRKLNLAFDYPDVGFPLTIEAEQVLARASQLARASGSSQIGTPHLFAGLLWSTTGSLARALSRFGLESSLRRALVGQEATGEDVAASGDAIEWSASVRQMHFLAEAAVAADGRHAVGEDDLLVAFIQQGGGSTGDMLRRGGLVPEALISRLFNDQGDLDASRFDEAAWILVEEAVRFARDKGHNVVGRSQLFYAMLATNDSEFARKLRQQDKAPEALADQLYVAIHSGPVISGRAKAKASNLSPGLIKILCLSEIEARQRPSGRISESILLRSLLADGGGQVGQFLVAHGVSWRRMM